MLKVALVGLTNVGKSTLFNKLVRRRQAIVKDLEGLTRDRIHSIVTMDGWDFTIIDTPGFVMGGDTPAIQKAMDAQSKAAMNEADALIIVLDGKNGTPHQWEHTFQQTRRQNKPVIVAVNKSDAVKDLELRHLEILPYVSNNQGIIFLSAEHSDGLGLLWEELLKIAKVFAQEGKLEEQTSENSDSVHKDLSLTILGQPNVGKSTLINNILGCNRLTTFDMPGTTRDSIKINQRIKDVDLAITDTAGLTKAQKEGQLENLMSQLALRQLAESEVVVVLIDATKSYAKFDLNIASEVISAGLPLIFALNKWDQVKNHTKTLEIFKEAVAGCSVDMRFAPIISISAKTGSNVQDIIDCALKARREWRSSFTTTQLNKWLAGALTKHLPPIIKGKLLKIKYVTQIKSRPPTFALFVNNVKVIEESYMRYLRQHLRDYFNLQYTPIRFYVRRP